MTDLPDIELARKMATAVYITVHETVADDLSKMLTSLCDEIERLNTRNQWQDISTAPKDGTYILGYVPNHGRALDVYWEDAGKSGGWWKTTPSWGHVLPTHWQPLPEPPED